MRIYQVEVINGSYEDKIQRTIICTTDLELAIEKSKIGAFDNEYCYVAIWENNNFLKFIEVDSNFEKQLRNL